MLVALIFVSFDMMKKLQRVDRIFAWWYYIHKVDYLVHNRKDENLFVWRRI